MRSFNVFSQFWKYVLLFGLKFVENEYEFPGVSTSRTTVQSDGGSVQEESIGTFVDGTHHTLTLIHGQS